MQQLMVIKPFYKFPLNPHGVSGGERRNYYHFAAGNTEAGRGQLLPFRGGASSGSQSILTLPAVHELRFEMNTFQRASHTAKS